jgi:hypothetical protein
MADDTLKRNLDRAFDPGPDFPHPLLISRTMAMLDAEAKTAGRGQERRMRDRRQPWAMTLVAALLALAVVAALLFTARSLHPKQVTPANPVPHGVGLCQVGCAVDSKAPIPAKPAAVTSCPPEIDCGTGYPQFASANVGYITRSYQTNPGSMFLYRTDDGGVHWSSQLSWDGPGATAIRISTDGREALVVGSEDERGDAALFHTTDAGGHWTALGLPISAAPGSMVSFLNPREGWVLSMGPTAGRLGGSPLADMFRTADSGAHWNLVARLDVTVQFSHSSAIGSVGGILTMVNASHGWFFPNDFAASTLTPWMYATTDGGATWHVQTIAAMNGVQFSGGSAIQQLEFFNDQEGVLEVTTGRCACLESETGGVRAYVYTTSDGGDHWTDPTPVPTSGQQFWEPMVFIDAKSWAAWPSFGGLQRTNDAGQHWHLLAPGLRSDMYRGFGPVWFGFLDSSHGWAFFFDLLNPNGSSTELYRTSNGGAIWNRVGLPG